MKYPLSDLQKISRDLTCFVLGHPWKSSWHRNETPMDGKSENLPYRQRESGNPYFEYSAGWHYKCRRCRHRTRDEAFQPFYVDYYRALRLGISSVVSSWGFRKDKHLPIRSWSWFIAFCVLSGLMQTVCFLTDTRHWPDFFQWYIVDAEWKASEKAFLEEK